jgi:hypothetical protein
LRPNNSRASSKYLGPRNSMNLAKLPDFSPLFGGPN